VKKVAFNIDVVSACNLRCPSCPMGNSTHVRNSKGIMPPDLLERILQKASTESEISFIGLFNWTEPLIHPKLPELVEIAGSYGPCHLSSNLNLLKPDFERLLRSNLAGFRISVSGFNQSFYSKTHQGGDVERVKSNMEKLSEAATKVGGKTKIEVLFHRYLGNADEEAQMKEHSEKLGFSFAPVWAYMMPVEKVLQFVKDPSRLSPQDIEIVGMLALPPDAEVIEASRSVRSKHCVLLEDQITLNNQGIVQLCCSVFDESRFSVSNYLEKSLGKIQRQKRKMKICRECMNLGIHNLMLYDSPKYDEIAQRRVLEDQLNLGTRCSTNEKSDEENHQESSKRE